MPRRFDAIVVGAGQAGPSLAARLDGAGMKIAIIERARFGGTCVNDGCTPTKTLIASAYAAQLARRAAEYGVRIQGEPSIDMQRVKARKDAIVAASNRGVDQWMQGLKNACLLRGHARFTGKTTLSVDGEELYGEMIFLDVGGRPLVPKMPGVDRVPYFTNVSMMDVDFVPKHLLVVGGSYVGLEFGQMYRRFGSRVT
ncbi:MAG: FAD-dependent oxidoreductase, partial [Bryobacteraceae bacterium]